MDTDTEHLRIVLEEHCVHELWQVRISAYEEATKLFRQWNGNDPNWEKVSQFGSC